MLDMVDTETVMNAAGTMGTLVRLKFIHSYILWQDDIFVILYLKSLDQIMMC